MSRQRCDWVKSELEEELTILIDTDLAGHSDVFDT